MTEQEQIVTLLAANGIDATADVDGEVWFFTPFTDERGETREALSTITTLEEAQQAIAARAAH